VPEDIKMGAVLITNTFVVDKNYPRIRTRGVNIILVLVVLKSSIADFVQIQNPT